MSQMSIFFYLFNDNEDVPPAHELNFFNDADRYNPYSSRYKISQLTVPDAIIEQAVCEFKLKWYVFYGNDFPEVYSPCKKYNKNFFDVWRKIGWDMERELESYFLKLDNTRKILNDMILNKNMAKLCRVHWSDGEFELDDSAQLILIGSKIQWVWTAFKFLKIS